jgi:hypothetical protein
MYHWQEYSSGLYFGESGFPFFLEFFSIGISYLVFEFAISHRFWLDGLVMGKVREFD